MVSAEFNIPLDQKTADAFATSWTTLPNGSIYTYEQFEEWFYPLTKKDIENKSVLELGCGNGSLLVHMVKWNPGYVEGVELGDSVISAFKNIEATGFTKARITKHDLTTFESDGFDVVYCIGVIHHLKNPKEGFDAVVRNVKKGGMFHCWVYAREGNALIIHIVDPVRKLASKLPWWFTKYLVATPLVIPYYCYAKLISSFKNISFVKQFPLYEYSCWIAKREFAFFRHVAFDQLVTPQTTYFERATIQEWLHTHPAIDPVSTYIIFRNGNSWKFGGRIKENKNLIEKYNR
jgi:SAM-dependent methyltransferase